MQSNWHGVNIADLMRSQLTHLADLIDTRIFLDGPVVRLKPAAAQALGMAVHELATNAAKYGALSNSRGRINVSWNIAGPYLNLRWSEHAGPPTVPPGHRGFGHTVIVQMVEHTLEAEVRLEYPRSGVVWELVAPADRVVE